MNTKRLGYTVQARSKDLVKRFTKGSKMEPSKQDWIAPSQGLNFINLSTPKFKVLEKMYLH